MVVRVGDWGIHIEGKRGGERGGERERKRTRTRERENEREGAERGASEGARIYVGCLYADVSSSDGQHFSNNPPLSLPPRLIT